MFEKKEIEVLEKNAMSMKEAVQQLQVRDLQSYKEAGIIIRRIKEVRQQWIEYWRPIKENAYKTWKSITTREKSGLDICDTAEKILKQKMLAWKQEEERKLEEERIRQQKLAEELVRKEKEKLLKQAEKIKSEEKKEILIQQAELIQPVVIQKEEIKVEGVQLRTVWKSKLTDIVKLVNFIKERPELINIFLTFNQKEADKFANAVKGQASIDGVEFYQEEILAVVNKKDISNE